MSMDPWEAEQEMAYAEMYEEHKAQALEDFRSDQLRSYYQNHPEIAKGAWQFLESAKSLDSINPSASLVMASAAAEVGVKALLLKPLIAGLTHTDAVAPLLTDMLFQQQVLEKFKPLLFDLLRRFGGVDLETHARADSRTTLWKEILENAKIRNGVVHRCESATLPQAQHAQLIAAEVLDVAFVRVIETLGFHLHDGYRICSEYHLPPELQRMIDANR